MLLREKWTLQAVKSYEQIISFILQEWTEREAVEFINSIEKSVLLIRRFPFIHAESNIQPGIRRCVIRKKTSLYYRVNEKQVEIIALIDNRIDPSKVKNYLK